MTPTPGTLPPGPQAAAWHLWPYPYAPSAFPEPARRRFGAASPVRLAGFGTLVTLADPEAVRGDAHALHSGEGNESLALTAGRHSVLALDGDAHARQRRALMPPLTGEHRRAFFTAMRKATLDEVCSWPVGGEWAVSSGQ